MRARLAISIIAVIGVLFTVGAGSAFAQGISGTDSAGQQQYGQTTPTTTPSETDVLGEIGEVEESQPAPAAEEAAPAPAPAPAPQAAAQPAQEQSGSLPFTGFATLAVVLLGVALLMGGLVLRRTTRERHHTTS